MSELPPLAFLDGAALSGGLVCVIAADWGLEDTFDVSGAAAPRCVRLTEAWLRRPKTSTHRMGGRALAPT
jgi:hypothetical protein